MTTSKAKFRFAPSPNGELHIGHAYSALLNLKLARMVGGTMLLRIEDIDTERCTPNLEKQMLEDLEWIGFEWDEPPLRQSDNFAAYEDALNRLDAKDLLYPTSKSRQEISKLVGAKKEKGLDWPTDPDGSPHYPGNERELSIEQWQKVRTSGRPYALRLSMHKALNLIRTPLYWKETESSADIAIPADPTIWGDVTIARKNSPTSYHLSCVVDDASQGITDVVRGRDLYHSTSVHRLLQELLGLPKPKYHHHELLLDKSGKKLSKSLKSKSLRYLRDSGHTADEVRKMIGKF